MKRLASPIILISLIAGSILTTASTPRAEPYPTRPIKIVAPFAAGGAGDVSIRIVAQGMSASLGQQVIVENRPGSGGIAAAQAVVRAKPDGYTLLLLANVSAISASLFKSLPYDIVNDFTQISTLVDSDVVILVAKNSRLTSVKDLVADAKAHPGQINIGVGILGTTQHLTAELFKSATRSNVSIVPFKSVGNLVTAADGAQVEAVFELLPPVLGYIKSGDLRPLAVSADRRFPGLPTVPTLAESGVENCQVTSWEEIAAPAHTPPAIIGRLNQAIAAALAEPDIQKKFEELGFIPSTRGTTPPEARKFLIDEISKWRTAITAAHIPLR